MCTSPDVNSSGSNFVQRQASQARVDEMARQQRLAFGLNALNRIFGGGRRPADFDSFLRVRGAAPANDVFAFGRSKEESDRIRQEFLEGGEPEFVTSPGFDPLIQRRRQAQLDFQLPQLQERFDDGRDELGFSLARAGLSNSSVAADRQARLGRMFQLEDAKVRSGIESDVANLRSRISQAKQSIEAQLRASADPSAAINTALAEQQRFFAEQPEQNTIGDVFAPIATGIGQAFNGFQTGRLSDRLNSVLTSGATGRAGSGRVVT